MSIRRRLQTASERNGSQSSPAPERSRPSNANKPIPFPDYTPPTCPLSADAQQAITNIRTLHNIAKLKKHLSTAIQNITTTTVNNNDRLLERKRQVEKNKRKRARDGEEDEIPANHKDLESHTRHLTKKVNIWTEQAEIAMRVLIDKGDEVERSELVIRDICDRLSVANSATANRRTRGQHDDEDANQDGEIISAVELLDQIKEEYKTKYEAESMTKRYASHNDYKSFKRVVHDSLYPDQDVPLPKESTWFPSDRSHPSAQGNVEGEGESSDDDIVIEKVIKDLKCPLTFVTFREPYTNSKCNHSFEKEAIKDYHRDNATVKGGQRVVKCPAMGCENFIAMADMYDDQLLLRQIKRAAQRAEQDDSDDEDDDVLRGTQRNRPQEVEDESTFVDMDDERMRGKSVKRERMSRPPTLTQVSTDSEDEDE
ncbi:hypothetical protein DID88_007831 [Monilinia fructigena]|uniref:SP-RING-type domain-containing protein n=1 Tax=Monilinia fructigena TaxID=38457 RepID=A0A395J3X6_9HELO|nr:hypothetical protein DID88_007831 [Monilinia fructigena]